MLLVLNIFIIIKLDKFKSKNLKSKKISENDINTNNIEQLTKNDILKNTIRVNTEILNEKINSKESIIINSIDTIISKKFAIYFKDHTEKIKDTIENNVCEKFDVHFKYQKTTIDDMIDRKINENKNLFNVTNENSNNIVNKIEKMLSVKFRKYFLMNSIDQIINYRKITNLKKNDDTAKFKNDFLALKIKYEKIIDTVDNINIIIDKEDVRTQKKLSLIKSKLVDSECREIIE